MLNGTSFTTMRSQDECVHTAFPKSQEFRMSLHFDEIDWNICWNCEGKWLLTFWTDSTPSCLRTCNKCSTHKAGCPRQSTDWVWTHRVQIVDFPVSTHHPHCRIQWRIARNDAILDAFRGRWLPRTKARRYYLRFLGTMSKFYWFWRYHCKGRTNNNLNWNLIAMRGVIGGLDLTINVEFE